MTFKDKHALETLPKTVAQFRTEIDKLQAVLADPQFYARDRAAFKKASAAPRRIAVEDRCGGRAMAGIGNPARRNFQHLTGDTHTSRLFR